MESYFHEYWSAAGDKRVQNDLREATSGGQWDTFFGEPLWLSIFFTAAATADVSPSSPALIALSPREFFQSYCNREVSVLRYRAFCAKYGLNKESKAHVLSANLTLPFIQERKRRSKWLLEISSHYFLVSKRRTFAEQHLNISVGSEEWRDVTEDFSPCSERKPLVLCSILGCHTKTNSNPLLDQLHLGESMPQKSPYSRLTICFMDNLFLLQAFGGCEGDICRAV